MPLTPAQHSRNYRARKKQARDPDELLLPAVEETLRALQLGEEDEGAAQLLRATARAIDEATPARLVTVLRRHGPQMHELLNSLGATPAARAAMARQTKGGPGGKAPVTGLDRIRAARARQDLGRGPA